MMDINKIHFLSIGCIFDFANFKTENIIENIGIYILLIHLDNYLLRPHSFSSSYLATY